MRSLNVMSVILCIVSMRSQSLRLFACVLIGQALVSRMGLICSRLVVFMAEMSFLLNLSLIVQPSRNGAHMIYANVD